MKENGWYLVRRWSYPDHGVGPCAGCGSDSAAWEIYHDPLSGEERFFDVCDECSYSAEVRRVDDPVEMPAERIDRALHIAHFWARRACVECIAFLTDYRERGTDWTIWLLCNHVELSHIEGGDEDADED